MLCQNLVPMESCVSTFIFGCLSVPQTGKHPNINVETQIPLELVKI